MLQGLNTALTSLYASRQALETTGNNIANVNTEGYSRQRVNQEEITSNRWGAFFSKSSGVGLGVNVTDIARLRDQFMETRALQEHSSQGALLAKKSTMETIELAFGEPSDSGIQKQLADFWANWDDLGNSPTDLAARAQVVEQAQTLVTLFGQSSAGMQSLASSSLEGMKRDINQVNSMAQNIADLNKAIKASTNSGVTPNDLLDKRDLLVSKLSELVDVTVTPLEAGSVSVNVGGVALVRDSRVTNLQVDSTATPITLRWDTDGDANTVTDGYAANIKGGKVGGTLESINVIIPKYQAMLDGVASSLITTVNTQHGLGLDQDGNAGGAFFTGGNASNVAVATAVANNSRLVAARPVGGGAEDGANAHQMAKLATSLSGPDAEYRKMIDLLGVEAQRSYNQVNIQTNITNSIDAARLATSGVNLDEEMTNLIKFQKSYNASAQYLSVLNQTLDSLLGIIR